MLLYQETKSDGILTIPVSTLAIKFFHNIFGSVESLNVKYSQYVILNSIT